MARSKRQDATPPAPRQMSRMAVLLTGVVLGAAWGSLMWLAFELAGRESGLRGWAYLAITMAMIGGGVAAIFGAGTARKRGERVSPRLPFGRRRDR